MRTDAAVGQIIFNRARLYVSRLGRCYNDFYVGITADPDRRRREHGNPRSWRCWKAVSVRAATDAEKMLHHAGMLGGSGGTSGAMYVYVLLMQEDKEAHRRVHETTCEQFTQYVLADS